MMSALLAIFLCAGCSGKKEDEAAPIQINPEKDIHELYKKVVKEREKTAARAGKMSREDEALREKHMAAADACMNKYTACLEKCKDSACEEKCLTALSVCEKDLPQNMKTVKEK
jgi:ribosome-binding ATPase YchF (GTP1/OBG family)